MSAVEVDSGRLDDPEALAEADPGDMLRQVASAAAQLREARLWATEAGIERVAEGGRPRAVVVIGVGGSALAGDLLAAVCGVGCPVPITTVRRHRLPGWVGAADLVIAVCGPDGTDDILGITVEAVRRGCRLLCVGADGSPLAGVAEQARAPFVPVRRTGPARSVLWALATPLLLAARALRLADLPTELLEATARRLEEVSHQCRPASESFVNPAKQTALDIAGSMPMIWGTSPLTSTVAYRFACQLAENAKYPAIHGELPETGRNQIAALEGAFGGGRHDTEDLFRDRVDEPDAARLVLTIVRDADENPRVAEQVAACADIAGDHGVPVTELAAQSGHPLERIAGLIAHVDYASVYLALATGVDPTPTVAVQELKERIS